MRNPVVADFESARRTSKNDATERLERTTSKNERSGIVHQHPGLSQAEKRNAVLRNLVSGGRESFQESLKDESERLTSVDAIRLLAERCLAAQEEERKRIAPEPPDGLSQELAMAAINLGILHRQIPGKWTPQIALISNLRQKMEFLSDGLRKMTHRLHPVALEHPGLIAAIRSYCSEFSQTSRIPVTFAAVQIPKLSPDLALCLYRTVQEGLLNVAKHSKATQAFVKIARAPGGILLSIVDNGCGFEFDDRHGSEGRGLFRIRERVQAVSGHLILNTAPGKGMRIEVYAPVRSREQ
jgi:signal transduction histidine kinase